MSTLAETSPKTSSVNPIPNDMRTVTPHLVCGDAAKAIEFYTAAFGAREICRVPGPANKIMHAALTIGDCQIFLVDDFGEMCAPGVRSYTPHALKGTSVTIHLQVRDSDALAEQAVKAGAKLLMPVQEMFWGDRYGMLEDPFGHRWSVGTHVRDVTPEQMQDAMAQMA
jgi:PhnB protein